MFTRGAVKDITVLVLILPPFLPEVGVDLFFVSFPTQGGWDGVGWAGSLFLFMDVSKNRCEHHQ